MEKRRPLAEKSTLITALSAVAGASYIVYVLSYAFKGDIMYTVIYSLTLCWVAINFGLFLRHGNPKLAMYGLAVVGIPVLIPWQINGGIGGTGVFAYFIYIPWLFSLLGKRKGLVAVSSFGLLTLIIYAFQKVGLLDTYYSDTAMLIFYFDFLAQTALIYAFQLSKERAEQANLENIQNLKVEKQKLQELNARNEATLVSIGDGLVAVDSSGVVVLTNHAATKLLGWESDELIGKKWIDITPLEDVHGQEIPIEKRPLAQVLKKPKQITSQYVYVRRDKTRVPVSISIAPVIIDGKTAGAIQVFRDISREAEIDRAKSEFVSLASHQLRTPLSAVNWYAEMLLHGDAGKLTADQELLAQEIYEGNQRMTELVNSLLDVSRLEVGRLTGEPQAIDVGELITSVEQEMATIIKTKRLKVSKNIQQVPVAVADPKQLRMVVQNYINNAIKYTPEKGHVHITLRIATATDIQKAKVRGSRDYLLFSVKDSGYGIPERQQPHIFEKLFRADNVRKFDIEGTGLGLYIVKQVTSGMGGGVWFESREGFGATFHAVIPLKAKSRALE